MYDPHFTIPPDESSNRDKHDMVEDHIRRNFGDPQQVIPELLEHHKSQLRVANEIGASQGWLSMWLISNGFERRVTWVRKQVVK